MWIFDAIVAISQFERDTPPQWQQNCTPLPHRLATRLACTVPCCLTITPPLLHTYHPRGEMAEDNDNKASTLKDNLGKLLSTDSSTDAHPDLCRHLKPSAELAPAKTRPARRWTQVSRVLPSGVSSSGTVSARKVSLSKNVSSTSRCGLGAEDLPETAKMVSRLAMTAKMKRKLNSSKRQRVEAEQGVVCWSVREVVSLTARVPQRSVPLLPLAVTVTMSAAEPSCVGQRHPQPLQ